MCPVLDRQGLEDEFNMAEEAEVVEAESVDHFEVEWERENSTVQGLKGNIERANEILDKVQDEIEHGNFSARLVEVAGQLINSVTAASKEILEKEYKDEYLGLRNKLYLLKKREVEIRALGTNRPKNQNLIVASREDVLKLLKDETTGNSESDSENEQKLLNG